MTTKAFANQEEVPRDHSTRMRVRDPEAPDVLKPATKERLRLLQRRKDRTVLSLLDRVNVMNEDEFASMLEIVDAFDVRVSHRAQQQTFLHTCSDPERAKRLLWLESDAEARMHLCSHKDAAGNTFLHRHLEEGEVDAWMLDALNAFSVAKIKNVRGETLLATAARLGRTNTVTALRHHSDILTRDTQGRTAVHLVKLGDAGLMDALCKHEHAKAAFLMRDKDDQNALEYWISSSPGQWTSPPQNKHSLDLLRSFDVFAQNVDAWASGEANAWLSPTLFHRIRDFFLGYHLINMSWIPYMVPDETNGEWPSHVWAVLQHSPQRVYLMLLDKYAMRRKDFRGRTAVHCMLTEATPFSVEELELWLHNLQHDPDIGETAPMDFWGTKGELGETALHLMCKSPKCSDEWIVSVLNNPGVSPCHIVTQTEGRFLDHSCRLLHDYDSDGFLPIHYACLFKGVDVVRALVHSHGQAPRTLKLPLLGDGKTCLHLAALSRHPDNLAKVRCLVEEFGMDVNAPSCGSCVRPNSDGSMHAFRLSSKHGWTPLHAALYGAFNSESGDMYLDVIRYLLQRGANVNAPCGSGHTPIHFASCKEHIDMLVEAGASVSDIAISCDSMSVERTPLESVVAFSNPFTQRHVETAKALLDNGAAIDGMYFERKRRGATSDLIECHVHPLSSSIRLRNWQMMELLVGYGASVCDFPTWNVLFSDSMTGSPNAQRCLAILFAAGFFHGDSMWDYFPLPCPVLLEYMVPLYERFGERAMMEIGPRMHVFQRNRVQSLMYTFSRLPLPDLVRRRLLIHCMHQQCSTFVCHTWEDYSAALDLVPLDASRHNM
jgi:ankyrin repeat protein